MAKIRVGVLRGGPGPAYEESLKTGAYVLSLLREHPEFEPVDIFISKDGEWHSEGLVADPHNILAKSDVAWNALHGQYGEGGEVQRLLHSLQHPFTGSGVSPSIFAHNKQVAKDIYTSTGLPTPAHAVLSENFTDEELIKIFQNYLHPVIVKPAAGVRGVGVSLARTFTDLKESVKRAFAHSPKVLVEEYVRGTVSTCSVLENVKGEDLYAFLPTHLETHHRRVRPTPEQNRQIEEYAKLAHLALGLSHYSSSDFIITPRGKIYIIETNSQPVFHPDSMLHRSLEASGWKPQDFVEHCLNQVTNTV